jgi:hypothetical protein
VHVVAGMVDMKKDCGKPGCPNDHRCPRSPVATRIERLPPMAAGVPAGRQKSGLGAKYTDAA